MQNLRVHEVYNVLFLKDWHKFITQPELRRLQENSTLQHSVHSTFCLSRYMYF